MWEPSFTPSLLSCLASAKQDSVSTLVAQTQREAGGVALSFLTCRVLLGLSGSLKRTHCTKTFNY